MKGKSKAKARGFVRVPFVRRCLITFDGGREVSAFLVNISVLGAYVAESEMPALNQRLSGCFRSPERERDVRFEGTVTWLNPRQQHPVHSLPPGFGIKLEPLLPEDRRCIEEAVAEYLKRNPQAGG